MASARRVHRLSIRSRTDEIGTLKGAAIELDGVPVRGVRRVSFMAGAGEVTTATLELVCTLDVDVEGDVKALCLLDESVNGGGDG